MKKGTFGIIITAIFLLAIIGVTANLEPILATLGVYQEEEEQDTGVINLLGDQSANVENLAGEGTSTSGSGETIHLRDKDLLYKKDNGVVTMYLTVSTGSVSEGTNHTWDEVNTYSAYDYREWGVDRYKVDGLLQVGTEAGIAPGSLGYARTVPNATVQVRGQTSSRYAQKNYKIRLKDNAGSWNGQTTIALNKHESDGLRFRNKMGFDLLSGVDELLSLRTTFVHLYVNDLTDGTDDGFEDYGLYTQVEQLNKKALRAHGLDRNGNLYKVNFFEFLRYEDSIKMSTDPTYDLADFETYIEVKGDDDHSKLIAMLDDVNDASISLDELIAKHFDQENLTYWLAFNILTGNIDTQSRNCYLYSPKNRDTWYFLCWDNDAFFSKDEDVTLGRTDYGGWERGVSNYWGNMLFRRCLKSESFRRDLDAAINDLRSYMSKEKLSGMVEEYESVVLPYLYSEPDKEFAPMTREQYDSVAEKLPDLVDYYYENYQESLQAPMPFYIGTPQIKGAKTYYTWDASYDFQQDDILYKAVVARDLEFKDVVASYEGYWTSFTGNVLEPGQYYFRVYAEDEEGHETPGFDYYIAENYSKVHGVLCIYVDSNGKIDIYEGEE